LLLIISALSLSQQSSSLIQLRSSASGHISLVIQPRCLLTSKIELVSVSSPRFSSMVATFTSSVLLLFPPTVLANLHLSNCHCNTVVKPIVFSVLLKRESSKPSLRPKNAPFLIPHVFLFHRQPAKLPLSCHHRSSHEDVSFESTERLSILKPMKGVLSHISSHTLLHYKAPGMPC
jgi:hypothetical protein